MQARPRRLPDDAGRHGWHSLSLMASSIDLFFGPLEPQNEVTWARGRFPDRTYIHSTFTLDLPASQDHGQHARYVVKVFDEPGQRVASSEGYTEFEYTEEVVHTTPGAAKLENLLTLDREASAGSST